MDLSNTCFVCLIPNQLVNNNILSRDTDGIVLQDKLQVILLELVDFRPDIPKYVCNICSQELDYVYKFRLKGLKSVTTLNDYFNNLETLHQEFNQTGSDSQNNSENYESNIIKNESVVCEDKIIVECTPTIPPESVYIKTEVDDNLENEITHSSFDDTAEENSLEDNANINHSKSSFLPVHIPEDDQITSSLYNNTDSNNLEDPDDQNEDNKKRHKCNECHKAFCSGRDLRRHIRTHTGERPYECDVCHRAFGEKYTLKNHKRTHKTVKQSSESDKTEADNLSQDDTSDKPHKCSLCPKSFFIPALLKRHMLSHTGERPFKCPTCPLTFKQSYNLTKHIRGTHIGSKPYACHVCSKAFCDNSSLKNHQRSHNPRWKCAQCEQGFLEEAKWRAHVRSHQMMHQCHVCEFSAGTEAELKVHVAEHPGEKPFVCEKCQLGFAVLGSLQKHVQRKHK